MQKKQGEKRRHVGGDGGSAIKEGKQERGMEEGLKSGECKGRPQRTAIFNWCATRIFNTWITDLFSLRVSY